MKQRRFRRLTAAIPLALLFAQPAQALTKGGIGDEPPAPAPLPRPLPTPPLPPVPPKVPPKPLPTCSEPTLADCQSPTYLSSFCGTVNKTRCGELVAPGFSAAVQSLPGTTQVLVGSGSSKLLRTARAFTSNLTAAGATTFGALTYQTASQVGRVVPAPSNPPNSDPQHPTWEANGAQIASCAEYAYEDSYDHSRFVEAAEGCGGNAECVYQLAQLAAIPGLNHLLKKKNGVKMAWQAIEASDGLKGTFGAFEAVNAEFSAASTGASGGAVAGTATLSPIAGTLSFNPLVAAQVATTTATFQTMNDFTVAGPSLFQPLVVQAVETNANFQQKKNVFFAYTPAFLRDLPAYASNAAFRAKADLIIAHINGTPNHTASGRFAWHQAMHDAYMPLGVTAAEEDDIRQRRLAYSEASGTYNVAVFAIALLDAVIPGLSGAPRATAEALRADYAASRDATAALRATALMAEWDHLSALDGTTLDRGCLSQSTIKCDWSPREFMQFYTGANGRLRETEFARCIEATGDDFGEVPAFAKGNTDTFTAWLDAAAVPKIDSSTIGQRLNDEDEWGDRSWFAAGYGYDAGWTLSADRDPSSGRICKLKGKAYAKANASAWALSHEFEVLNAETSLSVREENNVIKWHSHFRVLGDDLYDPIDGSYAGDSPSYDKTFDKTLAKQTYEKWITIAGVAVKLKAVTELKGGIDVHLKATAGDDCDPNNLAYDAKASARPWLKVHVVPEVSVGIGIIQGGVRGDVDLITAAVPVSGSVRLVGGVNDVTLKFGLNSQFVVEALGGSLSVFLETCLPFVGCADLASKQIYKWDPIRGEIPLFSYTKDLSLQVFDAATHPVGNFGNINTGVVVNGTFTTAGTAPSTTPITAVTPVVMNTAFLAH